MISERRNKLLDTVTVLIISAGIVACSGEPQSSSGEGSESLLAETPEEHAAAESVGSEHEGDDASSEGEGEHSEGRAREGGEHERAGTSEHEEHGEGSEHDEGGEGEGEEAGVYIGRGDTWDATRRGARLVLAFDPESNVFAGRVENTTQSMLCAVRVEVHLANSKELGPTERTDLRAGESIEIELPAGGEAFESWTAHPEVSRCSNQ